MVVVHDGHGLDARRQQQAGSRRKQRGVVPPLLPAYQVAAGRRDAAGPRAGRGQGGGGRCDGVQDGKGGETAEDAAPAPACRRRAVRALSFSCSCLPLMMFTHVPLLLLTGCRPPALCAA